MIEPEMLQAGIWPTWILVLVVSAAIWAQAFVKLIFGFGAIIDSRTSFRVSWLQLGWLVFLWCFFFAGYWPALDILAQPDWTFGEFLLMTAGALLVFLTATAIAPDATYAEKDGETRYLEIARPFFGLFAGVQLWLIVYDVIYGDGSAAAGSAGGVLIVLTLLLAWSKNVTLHKVASAVIWGAALLVVVMQSVQALEGTLVKDETAPLQGGIIAIWLASAVLSVALLIMITMSQVLNRHSGFRPYLTHAAWAVWLFAWMLLIWWRSPLLVTDGWEFYHVLFFSIAPLLAALVWVFILPQATEGSAEAAREQYFTKAPQAFRTFAALALWAIVMSVWFVDGASGTTGAIGWAIALVLLIALSRSSNPRLHAGVAAYAWIVIIAEILFELDRGVPAL